MLHAFGFKHGGSEYTVVGRYGMASPAEFSVALRIPKSQLRATLDAQSGVKLERTVTAISEAELVSNLELSYPGLTDFGTR